jgi:hypothetical protein
MSGWFMMPTPVATVPDCTNDPLQASVFATHMQVVMQQRIDGQQTKNPPPFLCQ